MLFLSETKQPHSDPCVCYTLGFGRRKPIKGAKGYVVLPLDVVVLRQTPKQTGYPPVLDSVASAEAASCYV